MQSVPGMQDAAIIAAVVSAFIAGMMVMAIFRPRASTNPLDKNFDVKAYKAPRSNWLTGVAVGVIMLGLTSWLSQRDELELRDERLRDFHVKLSTLGCPAKQTGDTDLILFTIDTSADLHTDKPFKAVHCSRIVERGWIRQQPKPAIAAR